MRKLAPHIFMLWALCACASAGLAPAQTFNQREAYAIGIHKAVLEAATVAVTNGTLSSSDAQAVLSQADTAKSLLDAAQALNVQGDMTGANNKLTLALGILTTLQNYLNTHGSK